MERCIWNSNFLIIKDPAVIAKNKKQAAEHNMSLFVSSVPLKLKDTDKKVVKGRKQDRPSVTGSSQAKRSTVNVSGQVANSVPFIPAASSSLSENSNTQSFASEFEKLKEENKFLRELALQAKGGNELQQEIKQEIESISSRLKNIEDYIFKTAVSKQSAVSLATCSNSSVTGLSNAEHRHLDVNGDKVLLGDGIMCSLTSYQTMLHTKSKQDWCGALLYGVFGEMAKNYRYKIHKKNEGKLLRFPKEFNNVAKVMYSQFLRRMDPSMEITDTALKSVLTLLSVKARDMNGRRNKSLKSEETIEIVVDPRLVIAGANTFEVEDEEVLISMEDI